VKYCILTILTAACLLAPASARAADAIGTWKGTMTTNEGGKFPMTIVLKKDGDSVTGTVVVGTGDPRVVQEVKTDADTVTFKTVSKTETASLTMVYTGVVDDDMQVTMGREGATTRQQKAALTRQKD
jgi:hypothetical protein